MRSAQTERVVRTAVKGTKWVYLTSFVPGICQPIFLILLARLLVPSDFGLMAFATIFMSVVGLVQDLGLGQALIQKKKDVEKAADVVFIINIVLGIIWFAVTLLVAPYVADYFDNLKFTRILRVMALGFLIAPFGSVQNSLLMKKLYFKKLFYLSILPAIVPGFISIMLALLGFGIWSLVYASLIGTFLNALTLWLTVPWRPVWRFDRTIAVQMLKFGRLVSAESVLSWMINTLDDVLVGKWLGSAALGFYTVGFKIGIGPAKYISSPIIKLVYPALSKLQEDKSEIREIFLKIITYISLITFPLATVIATTASIFVPVLFGGKWIPSIPVIQFISLYGIFMSIGSIIPQVYKALDRPDIYLKYVFVRSVVAIPVYYYAIPYGLTIISLAHLVLTVLFFPVNFYIGMRVMEISWKNVFDSLWIATVGSFCVAVVAIVLQKIFISGVQLSALWTMIMTTGIVIICYISFILIANKDMFYEIRTLLKTAVTRN